MNAKTKATTRQPLDRNTFPEDRDIAANVVTPHRTKWCAYESGYPDTLSIELMDEFDTEAEAVQWLREWYDVTLLATPFIVPPVISSSKRRAGR